MTTVEQFAAAVTVEELDRDPSRLRATRARVDGAWYALEAWCTHAECPLTDGWVEGVAIRCPCHGSLFDLVSGAPLEGPADEPVRGYRTRVVGDRVEVEML